MKNYLFTAVLFTIVALFTLWDTVNSETFGIFMVGVGGLLLTFLVIYHFVIDREPPIR
jgi:hypothetical protein